MSAKVETLPAKLPAQTPSVFGRLKGGLKRLTFDRDEREFLPAHIEILQTPTSPMAVTILWTICLMFTAALVWSILAKLDIHAVAHGRVQPNGRSKLVQPFDPGTVKAIQRAERPEREGGRRADRARPDRGAGGRRRGDRAIWRPSTPRSPAARRRSSRCAPARRRSRSPSPADLAVRAQARGDGARRRSRPVFLHPREPAGATRREARAEGALQPAAPRRAKS